MAFEVPDVGVAGMKMAQPVRFFPERQQAHDFIGDLARLHVGALEIYGGITVKPHMPRSRRASRQQTVSGDIHPRKQ